MTKDVGVLVDGVWLPSTELHLADMMRGKRRQVIDGKATYQKHKLDACLELLPKNRRRGVLDIGAHVGLWSMWLVNEFDFLHAVEPVPEHRELFERNLAGKHYALYPVALGEAEGVVDIEIPLETTGNAHIAIGKRHPGTRHVPNPDAQRVVKGIKMLRLDAFDLHDIDFVKIDVEGFERAVVAGGETFFKLNRPLVIVEQKGNDSAYGDAPNAAVALLESWGARTRRVMAGDFILSWD